MMPADARPWYRRCLRWGQTNITELDPLRYDIDWWRQHWRRTQVQGVIVNAGGIVAYYPSEDARHYRAQHLGDRDLYGELVAAARAEGLAVLARMDSNRATETFYQAHPDWFARDQAGNPYRAGDRYVACINSDYYDEYLPALLREIIAHSHPDGFTDNSWSGLTRNQICHCHNCAERFQAAYGHDLPARADWDDPIYRRWVRWNYDRRLAVWDLNNRVTQEHGGADCLWLGMISGDPGHESIRFRDVRAVCARTEILMLDYQHRPDYGFQANSHAGKLLHELLGWDKLIPESMPMYQGRAPTFRLASKPAPEARLWMVEGFAGTIQPWWHHISAYHEDRRQYRTAEPLMTWHAAHESYLIDRTPVATVGVIWSQENIDFFGREQSHDAVLLPYWGMVQALIRARIPYLPVHADDIEHRSEDLDLLILPNVGALSDAQCAAIRRFVARSGALLASGQSSLYTEWGERRADFALADLLGVHARGEHWGGAQSAAASWELYTHHSYLRIHPALRSQVYGPQVGIEPPVTGQRHPALAGFDETDILPFGGRLELVHPAADAQTPLTYIPPFPIYPPEFAWMRKEDSGAPALALRDQPEGGRVAYLAADLDRYFGRDNLPDHGDLLANLARWLLRERLPLTVDGPGLLDCQLYRQGDRLVLHVVNLTNPGAWRAPVHELIPVGPLRIRVRLPAALSPRSVELLVNGSHHPLIVEPGWAMFEIPSLLEHEVAVLA